MAMHGYTGRMARINLSTGAVDFEELEPEFIKTWVGGVGFAARQLWQEVPVGLDWDEPDNPLIWTTGPLAGSGVYGAATFNVAAKGPMTNMAGCSQANGYFGAYLKFSGFDGFTVTGRAAGLSYLVFKDGRVEIRDGAHLAGLDLLELEETLRNELGAKGRRISVFGIGPAGENLVRHASIGGDGGHMAGHNGLGAVMGSKNLKAVVAWRAKPSFTIADPAGLKAANEELFQFAKSFGVIYEWGSGGGYSAMHNSGTLPVKNYTTNIWPKHEQMNAQYLRTHFKVKNMPCYKCRISHVKEVEVTEGPYTGFVGEEPEYEQLAAWGPVIGNEDLGAVVMLTAEVERLGMDCNESSWTIGWAMECFNEGLFTLADTGGLDLSWGNVEAVKELLGQMARRQGFGALLAEGVKRASEKTGGPAADKAIYTLKGASPRGHDHRGGRWSEMLDTCVSNTSTIESTWAGLHTALVDLPPVTDPYDHKEVAELNARYNGVRQFDDCLGTCRFASPHPKLVLACLNAATGWDLKLEDAFAVGLRVVNQLRMFNLRHGLKRQLERPSKRYGSRPKDGPGSAHEAAAHWDDMLDDYYRLMGWDNKGRPRPETLKKYGLADLVEHL